MDNLIRKDKSDMRDGINNRTYELLFGDNFILHREEWQQEKYTKALNAITLFTRIRHNKILYPLLKICDYVIQRYNLDKIKYNKETKRYEYNDIGVSFNFDLMSNGFDDKEIIKELQSRKRERKCHIRATDIGPSIDNSKIVTGYVTLGKNKFLHTVVEVPGKNDIVLDWTMNVIMRKEDYIKLMGFEEISSFESINVINDLELLVENTDLGAKTYVTFRDEIMREIKSKPELFKVTEKGRESVSAFKEAKLEASKRQ